MICIGIGLQLVDPTRYASYGNRSQLFILEEFAVDITCRCDEFHQSLSGIDVVKRGKVYSFQESFELIEKRYLQFIHRNFIDRCFP